MIDIAKVIAGITTLDDCDALIRQLDIDVVSIKDQIASHMEHVQLKLVSIDVHWLNKARTARRVKEAQLAELRAHRVKLRPGKDILRRAILDVVKERLGTEAFKELVEEARDRVAAEVAA